MALAPAKLNLYLDVLGRRADGYHELESLFVALDWGDEIGVQARREPGVTLILQSDAGGAVPPGAHAPAGAPDPLPPGPSGVVPSGPSRVVPSGPSRVVPSGRNNLAVQAAVAWLAAQGAGAPFPGVALTLTKRIPLGGGLGGGSSDAGAVLRGLEALAPAARRLGQARLTEVARGLGADVPFFLHVGPRGGAAVGRGRGDEIEPLAPPPPLNFVLITPPWGHATAEVFAKSDQRLRQRPGESLAEAVAALASGQPQAVRAAHWNALALPAMRAYPAFTRFTSAVERRLGRAPCLSGTGSTLFDVADDPAQAQAQAQALRLEGLGARVLVARCG